MLKRLTAGRQKYGFYRYAVRAAGNQINKLLFKSNRRTISRTFNAIGVERDMTVCVHASLSQLGYIPGGADTVVDALFELLGADGCIVMPSFSMIGTMLGYLESGTRFDVRHSPAQVGAIGEAFRRRAGVLRSLHPTNSVTAFGRGARELLADHDRSRTPYGHATPYGRLVENENAYILMLNTHVQSLLHHLQERVGFPNLFLEKEKEVSFVDYEGTVRSMTTKVMRPRIPYYVAVPAQARDEPDWALLHDFCLMVHSKRSREIKPFGYRFDGCPELYDVRKRLISDGTLRVGKLGRGEIALLNVAKFVRATEPRLRESIRTFARYYDLHYLEKRAWPPMV